MTQKCLDSSIVRTTISLSDGSQHAVTEILMAGHLSFSNVNEFRELLDELSETETPSVALNFSDLEYISSTGVGGIIKYIEAFEQQHGCLFLIKIPEGVRHIIDLLGL